MPHISVKLYPGRSQEMKENLARKLQECLAEESGCWGTKDISVSFEEIGPEGFEETVKAGMKPEELLLTSDFVH